MPRSTARRSSTTCSIHRRRRIAGELSGRQDYGRLFDHTRDAGVASSASAWLAAARCRAPPSGHPIASPAPEPIGSAMSYDADIDRARRLMPLVSERVRRQPDRSRHAICAVAPGDGHHPGRFGRPPRNSTHRWMRFGRPAARGPRPSIGAGQPSPANRDDRPA